MNHENPPGLTAKDLGGEDEPEEDNHEPRSCDKYNHECRSIVNDPTHLEHWHGEIVLPENTVINLTYLQNE